MISIQLGAVSATRAFLCVFIMHVPFLTDSPGFYIPTGTRDHGDSVWRPLGAGLVPTACAPVELTVEGWQQSLQLTPVENAAWTSGDNLPVPTAFTRPPDDYSCVPHHWLLLLLAVLDHCFLLSGGCERQVRACFRVINLSLPGWSHAQTRCDNRQQLLEVLSELMRSTRHGS